MKPGSPAYIRAAALHKKRLKDDPVYRTACNEEQRLLRLLPKCQLTRREYRLKSYNITPVEYDAKLTEQNGLCAICKQPETKIDYRSGKVWPLSVDHNHETGENRGLLCSACNPALGMFQDSIAILQAAIAYLVHYSQQ